MLYLRDEEVAKLLDGHMDDAVEIMREMFRLMGEGDYALGGERGASHGMRIDYKQQGEGRIFLAMPGYLGGNFNVTGVKWHGPNAVVEGNDSDCHFIAIINNANTGEPLAAMGADTLTRYRTAAVNALAATALYSGNPEKLAIIGPGRINRLSLEYLLTHYSTVKTVEVKGRGILSRDKFISDFQECFPEIKFLGADTCKEAVENADIALVNGAMLFENYKDMTRFRNGWLKTKSTFVCSAYAYFPTETLVEASYRVCDLYGMYEEYERELGYPAFKACGLAGNRFADLVHEGKLQRSDISELSEFVSGRKSVAEAAAPIIFTSGGLALEDIALGQKVYQMAKEQGIGTEVK